MPHDTESKIAQNRQEQPVYEHNHKRHNAVAEQIAHGPRERSVPLRPGQQAVVQSKRLKREESVGAGTAFSQVMVAPSRSADFRPRFPCGLVLEWSGEADSGQLTRLVKALA